MAKNSAARFDLEHLNAASVEACDRALRTIAAGAESRQEAAARVVNFFYECFEQPSTGKSACVLARCFQTCSYALLPLDYQHAADRILESLPEQPSAHDEMRCLALLATHGERSLWNDPRTSVGHQAIPLPSAEFVEQAPMISRLMKQLGVPIHRLITAPGEGSLLLEELPREFNVFHIPKALGSPFIPGQANFVVPFGVQSAVGMGGPLPDGQLFAVVIFSRVPVSREVATFFRTLAASVRQALEPFPVAKTFAGSVG